MVSNIMSGVQKSKLLYFKPPPSKHRPTRPDSVIPIDLAHSLEYPQLSDDTRGLVVDALLHDLVCSLLNRTFFTGKHFFGVGSEPLHDYLETMFSKLVESENPDPIAIQRWRSMSVEAVFQMNDGVVSQLNNHLRKELRRLLNRIVLPVGPPGRSKSKSVCESIVREEEQSLLDIICQARQLSFMVQHKVVSCQLLVTIAPMQASSNATTSSGDAVAGYKDFDKAVVNSIWKDVGPQDGEKVFGTYSFGLRRISASGCDILIQPRVISSALLQSI